jgi:hypothetical protein
MEIKQYGMHSNIATVTTHIRGREWTASAENRSGMWYLYPDNIGVEYAYISYLLERCAESWERDIKMKRQPWA